MNLAKDSLVLKRKKITELTELGLFPYTKKYLHSYRNHFNTIGICGMNEACLNFLDCDISNKEGKFFAEKILDFMREKMVKFQDETGSLFNLEATPAESTSYRLAKHDKKNYPDIISSGDNEPFYTNSSQLPVDYTSDVFEALDHQESLQSKYTGGTVFHAMLGEKISDWNSCKELVRSIAFNYKLPYFTLSPVYSICPIHGYLDGEHQFCPKCKDEKTEKLQNQILELEEKLKEENNECGAN
jgi:ribonucleoside-triphosphate reductase